MSSDEAPDIGPATYRCRRRRHPTQLGVGTAAPALLLTFILSVSYCVVPGQRSDLLIPAAEALPNKDTDRPRANKLGTWRRELMNIFEKRAVSPPASWWGNPHGPVWQPAPLPPLPPLPLPPAPLPWSAAPIPPTWTSPAPQPKENVMERSWKKSEAKSSEDGEDGMEKSRAKSRKKSEDMSRDKSRVKSRTRRSCNQKCQRCKMLASQGQRSRMRKCIRNRLSCGCKSECDVTFQPRGRVPDTESPPGPAIPVSEECKRFCQDADAVCNDLKYFNDVTRSLDGFKCWIDWKSCDCPTRNPPFCNSICFAEDINLQCKQIYNWEPNRCSVIRDYCADTGSELSELLYSDCRMPAPPTMPRPSLSPTSRPTRTSGSPTFSPDSGVPTYVPTNSPDSGVPISVPSVGSP